MQDISDQKSGKKSFQIKFRQGQKWKNHNGVVLRVNSVQKNIIRETTFASCVIIHHPLPFAVGWYGTFTVEELLDEGYQVVKDMDLFHGKVC